MLKLENHMFRSFKEEIMSTKIQVWNMYETSMKYTYEGLEQTLEQIIVGSLKYHKLPE